MKTEFVVVDSQGVERDADIQKYNKTAISNGATLEWWATHARVEVPALHNVGVTIECDGQVRPNDTQFTITSAGRVTINGVEINRIVARFDE